MSMTLVQLEQAWLQAEAIADEARREAERMSGELAERNRQVADMAEMKILLGSVEQAKARRDEADRVASAAFDRFWSAKDTRSLHA
jgi:hypothetical protein